MCFDVCENQRLQSSETSAEGISVRLMEDGVCVFECVCVLLLDIEKKGREQRLVQAINTLSSSATKSVTRNFPTTEQEV